MNWKKNISVHMCSIWALALLLLLSPLQSGSSILGGGRYRNEVFDGSAVAQIQATSTVHPSGLPKVDEIIFKAYPGATPDRIVQGFLDGETDWIGGPARNDLYQSVVDAGHKVSEMRPMAEFTFFPINCRDYKYTSGEPNAPLNDSNWRLALSYVYGMDDKQAHIDSYYHGVPWKQALGNPVPPAQEPWYDDSVVMPDTDNETAWNILSSAGYAVQNYSGQPWLHRNNIPVRPPDGPNGGVINLAYTTTPDGRELRGIGRNWNAFLQDYVGADGPTMVLVPTDFTTLVTDLRAVRNYDIIGIGLTNLGRYVDWIHDFFHSSNDIPWEWNLCGIHDDDFDRWAEIILESIDAEEVIEATENFTWKFVNELMPWFPVLTDLEFCTTARDERGELTNVIPTDDYGSTNNWILTISWNYMGIHWKGEPDVAWPGGTVNVAVGDEAKELNPWTDNTAYSWQILDRSVVGLLMVEPENMWNMPFVATDWEIEYLTFVPELGIVNGCRCTFWLRQDVTWHDGRPATAYDCVANLRFLKKHQPGGYSNMWEHLVYEEADGPYKFNVYLNQSTLRYISTVAEAALLVPKHIIEVVEDHWKTWDPSQLDYEDLGLGPSPPAYPWMKQLVGCGPFVFDYYNRDQAVGRVERYQDFFVNSPVIGSVAGEWRVDPLGSYTYKPLVQNMAAVEADENGTLTAVTVDVKIYEDEVLTHELDSLYLDSWNWTYLGPYTIESAACGLHNVTVEVYDHTDQTMLHSYTHTFVATVREDLTSYTGETLDFNVDMKDVGRAAKAFGSIPGHLRWDPVCDVNHDFTVDMRDIGGIARKFGWSCP